MAGFVLGLWVSAPRDPGSDPREPVIALHVASFENGAPRIEVASSDRHVVKPWFAGKLDFAPTVRDLSEHGVALLGGRLDTLGGQPAAVLAYRIRRHQISLVIARSAMVRESPLAVSTLRGFAVATWAHDGLTHSAVADVDARELQRFAELFSGSARP
jgi:anti-sigma factor RsiW